MIIEMAALQGNACVPALNAAHVEAFGVAPRAPKKCPAAGDNYSDAGEVNRALALDEPHRCDTAYVGGIASIM